MSEWTTYTKDTPKCPHCGFQSKWRPLGAWFDQEIQEVECLACKKPFEVRATVVMSWETRSLESTEEGR